MAPATPNWNSRNLARHHRKRLREDSGCFEDLLKIIGRVMTATEYETRSQDAVANAWAEYEGEGRNVQLAEYYPAAAYFVDEDLVVAVTDPFKREFITCYHEHLDKKMVGHAL